MGKKVTVRKLPSCDFCDMNGEQVPAEYDFPTRADSRWANGCEEHWKMHRRYPDLGTGKGQKLVVKENDASKPAKDLNTRHGGMAYDTWDAAVGKRTDGDQRTCLPAVWTVHFGQVVPT